MSKIIKLQAENVKRLKAVEITPDGNTVIITGRNEQGKSSVLDSICYCLGGKDWLKDTPTPIHTGAEDARVRIETEDLIVERTWTANDKTYLKVMAKDGASYSSPQAMLDKLIGNLSFDPLEFSKQEQSQQVATLLQLIDLKIDLRALAEKKKQLYDERTAVNREFKTLQTNLSQLTKPEMNLPDEEVSIESLTASLKGAFDVQRENDNKRKLLSDVKMELVNVDSRLTDVRERINTLLVEQKTLETNRKTIQERIAKGSKIVDGLTDPSVIDIQQEIDEANELNALVRTRNAYAHIENELGEKHVESERLTGEMEALEKSKNDAIAKAKFPITGLSFDENGVTYKGIPFTQCSSAERLRVSLAIAMSLNPKLRVIRIMDGSLLDKDNLKLVSEMAKEKDFQIWIEEVSNDNNNPLAVYIEDGMVVPMEVKKPVKKNGKERQKDNDVELKNIANEINN